MLKKILFVSGIILMGALVGNGANTTAPFEIQYTNPKIPDSVKRVVDTVAKVWAQYIKSDLPIRVAVNWRSLNQVPESSREVAATCQPTTYTFGVLNNKQGDTLYPIALAEKLSGRELNNQAPDISLIINDIAILDSGMTVTWYCTLDGKVPPYRMDMFTVLLHEFAHGLGVNGSLVSSETNKLAFNGGPTIFDYFISAQNKKSKMLSPLHLSANKPDSLHKYVTDTAFELYFESPYLKLCNKGQYPKLFKEESYEIGRSVYHFDEKTYPAGNINALMTPAFDYKKQESIHSPGSMLLGVLASLGWTEALFDITKPKDFTNKDSLAKAYFPKTEIFAHDTVSLYYFYDDVEEKKIATKTENETDFVFTVGEKLPLSATVYYFFSIKDSHNNEYTIPLNATKYYRYNVGKDKIAPEISHKEPTAATPDASLRLSALVYENIAIDSVYVQYRVGAAAGKYVKMTASTKPSYSCEIPKTELIDKQVMSYSIIGVDKSGNKTILPTSGQFSVSIKKIEQARLSYINDFTNTSTISDFIITPASPKGFMVSDTVKNFEGNGILVTEHPYRCGQPDPTKKSSSDNITIDYIAKLSFPIKLQYGAAFMEFDEVVLVEPGVDGVVWGDYGFYDYVIVEGSKNDTVWYPFEMTGYDSKSNADWYDAYIDNVEHVSVFHKVSHIEGTPKLFKHHQINLLQNKYLKAGTDILIRFRLYSDMFSYGWGWAIDNLKIQPNAVDQPEFAQSEPELSVYPNPTSTGSITINAPFAVQNEVSISIVSASGQIVLATKVTGNEIGDCVVTLPTDASGLYTAIISSNQQHKSIRFTIQK